MRINNRGSRPASRLRLGLRSLLLLILIISVVLGRIVVRARAQGKLLEAIRSAGGVAHYDWDSAYLRRKREPARRIWPGWLVRSLGPDYFDEVALIHLQFADASKVSGDLLEQISGLGSLEELYLPSENSLGDRDLARFGRLTNLRTLRLGGAALRGPGLSHLLRCRKLEDLEIHVDGFSDQDLSCLSGLRTLRRLTLESKAITDDGLAHLAPLEGLEQLVIDKSSIEGRGFGALGHLKSITYISIDESPLSTLEGLVKITSIRSLAIHHAPMVDDALACLTELRHLEHLALFESPFTDRSTVHLARLDSLTNILLYGLDLTDAGIRNLMVLPRLNRISCRCSRTTWEGLSLLERKYKNINFD